MNKLIGQPIRRSEDHRLLTGAGHFTDDANAPGQVHAVMVRSPHPHARMLAIDSREAEKRRLAIEVVQASMDQLSPLRDEAFDIVHQPVSSCYVASLEPVFGEVARVLRDGGLYVSQHKQPASLQVSHRDRRDRYVLGVEYFHEGPLPEVPDKSYREDGTLEFLHRWEQLVGTLCQAGFVIEDLREPLRADRTAQPGDFRHRGRFIPPYVRLKARRNPREETGSTTPLWTPDS